MYEAPYYQVSYRSNWPKQLPQPIILKLNIEGNQWELKVIKPQRHQVRENAGD